MIISREHMRLFVCGLLYNVQKYSKIQNMPEKTSFFVSLKSMPSLINEVKALTRRLPAYQQQNAETKPSTGLD